MSLSGNSTPASVITYWPNGLVITTNYPKNFPVIKETLQTCFCNVRSCCPILPSEPHMVKENTLLFNIKYSIEAKFNNLVPTTIVEQIQCFRFSWGGPWLDKPRKNHLSTFTNLQSFTCKI